MQPKSSLLSGLRTNPSASMAGKGQQMSGAAGLGMEQAQQDQQLGLQSMQANSQMRQQQAANNTQRTQNTMQQGMAESQMAGRAKAFNTQLGYDYARLGKQQSMQWRQAALNAFARDL